MQEALKHWPETSHVWSSSGGEGFSTTTQRSSKRGYSRVSPRNSRCCREPPHMSCILTTVSCRWQMLSQYSSGQGESDSQAMHATWLAHGSLKCGWDNRGQDRLRRSPVDGPRPSPGHTRGGPGCYGLDERCPHRRLAPRREMLARFSELGPHWTQGRSHRGRVGLGHEAQAGQA